MIAFRSSIPLFIFGVLRFILTWMVGYHLHVTEYGVHWNFFFTMFIVTFSSYFMNIEPQNGLKVGIVIGIFYQIFLSLFGTIMYFIRELLEI